MHAINVTSLAARLTTTFQSNIMVHVLQAKHARDGPNVRLWRRDVAGPAVS